MTPESNDLVLREDVDGIATLTLNRGQAFNALSEASLDALDAAIEAVGTDQRIRAVIIGGAGRAFCAGHDLKEIAADPSRATMAALFKKCARVMLSLNRIPQPVIARVHGIATAAGCQLVAACDLAVAANMALFATSGINVGLFCSTPMVALTRNVPRKIAFEMLMTGEYIKAEQALAYGLVNRVVPLEQLEDETLRLARIIASKSPAAIAMGKKLFYEQIERAQPAAYDLAAPVMADNMQLEDARAGIDAFTRKEKMPDWKGK
jgi:enoyl-CoA hydratase/carnithine racemase